MSDKLAFKSLVLPQVSKEYDMADARQGAGFAGYESIVGLDINQTQLSGRYNSQADAERLILGDLLPKLQPQPDSTLLDIGCGPGQLLIPLSFLVKEAVGIDNANVLARLKQLYSGPNLSIFEGPFPLRQPDRNFTRILAYSVIQNLPDAKSALGFVLAAAALLAPGGRMVIGDLPNHDRKRRFLTSTEGAAFDREWRARQAPVAANADPHMQALAGQTAIGSFGDADILAMLAQLRARGFDAYIAAQDKRLPFGNTREDLIVARQA